MDMEVFRRQFEMEKPMPTQEFVTCAEKLCQEVQQNKNEEQKTALCREIYGNINKDDVEMTVFLYSMLVNLDYNPKYMEEFARYVIEEKRLNYKNKYFLFYQITQFVFLHPEFETEEVLTAKWELLKQVEAEIKQEIKMPLHRIPRQECNPNMVVVITEQFLGTQHGPTKTALDRCAIIKRGMGKEVLLINTAEFMPMNGRLSILGGKRGNYDETLCQKEYQTWQGVEIPYFQVENVMPEAEVEELLLHVIEQIKPMYVINIGGSSLFAGLADELVPVITVGTTQSGLATTLTTYQTVHGKLDEKWLHVLKNVGKNERHMIEGIFTFSLREQTETTTREKEGLPENQFLLAVVGGRLDEEVTEEFFHMLKSVVSKEIGIVFIGKFEHFGEMTAKYPEIKPYAYYLGFCQDILSKLEICDLYVNPTRKGGGTSVVEAMSKGKPAVSVDFGDVAGIIGEEFCCKNYEEMAEIIKRYAQDRAFYEERAQAAGKVADVYLDTASEFKRIMEEYDRREKEET